MSYFSSPTHAHTYPHTLTRPRAYAHARTLAARQSEQSMIGGVSLQSVSTTWRNVWRCTPFLTTLGTHCISRSGPRSPTRSAYSPASPLSPWLSAPRHTHTQSRPSGRAIKHHTRTQHSVLASPQSRSARLHRMRVAGNTLEASCCRTCRRRCAKRRLRRLLAADG
jgi:hypothetical protein